MTEMKDSTVATSTLSDGEVPTRVEELLAKMSLAEQVGQLTQIGAADWNTEPVWALQMREYVKNCATPQFALWKSADLGYLAVYAMHALAVLVRAPSELIGILV
jgi:hypothetical protein